MTDVFDALALLEGLERPVLVHFGHLSGSQFGAAVVDGVGADDYGILERSPVVVWLLEGCHAGTERWMSGRRAMVGRSCADGGSIGARR